MVKVSEMVCEHGIHVMTDCAKCQKALEDFCAQVENKSKVDHSFRDQCSIAAMQALISTDNYGSVALVCAVDAFDFADAMEAERLKRAK